MLTGYENLTNATLVKAYNEARRGPMSAKAEAVEQRMKDELDKRRISPRHPAFALVSAR